MKAVITIKNSQIKSRVVWDFKPTTRVKPSKRVYNRKKIKADVY
jgi:hypothetical protein